MGTDRTQPLTLICNYPDARLYTLSMNLANLKILDEQELTENDRDKLKRESEAKRSKGIAMVMKSVALIALYCLLQIIRLA